jgi:hypothetical protein
MNSRTTFSLAWLMALGLFVGGCNSESGRPAAEPQFGKAADAEHGHPNTGPHGGDLIELGDEQYHAEITHDNEATVYLLDDSARAAAAVDATEVVINVSQDGKAEQFRLTANRDAQDPEGKVSRFSSDDAELLADLKSGDAEIELVVSISGKQYRGSREHDHGEEGHDH